MKNFFESPALFAEHLVKVAFKQELALHEGLKAALRLIRNRARQKMGHYQDQSGPFQDWAELAEATKEERLRLGYTENDPLLRSGELRNSIVDEAGVLEGVT